MGGGGKLRLSLCLFAESIQRNLMKMLSTEFKFGSYPSSTTPTLNKAQNELYFLKKGRTTRLEICTLWSTMTFHRCSRHIT
jgi:hypothetical protein